MEIQIYPVSFINGKLSYTKDVIAIAVVFNTTTMRCMRLIMTEFRTVTLKNLYALTFFKKICKTSGNYL